MVSLRYIDGQGKTGIADGYANFLSSCYHILYTTNEMDAKNLSNADTGPRQQWILEDDPDIGYGS